jgi:chromosome segregation ATPase
MSQTSLTSLRKSPPSPDTSKFSPHDRAQVKLDNLQAEIDLLTKKKDNLTAEVESAVKTGADTRKRVGREIGKLKKRRKLLLGQVDRLAESFDFLKGSQEKASEAFDKFGQERVAVLTGISNALQLDVQKELSKLSVKSKKVSESEGFLTELADYLVRHSEIVEAEASLNARRGVELNKEVSKVLKEGERLKKVSFQARELLQKAKSKWSEVDGRYERADKLASFFENEADREKARLEIWARTVDLREKKAKKQKRLNKEVERENDEREGWLDDREKTLGRTISRLRKAGHDIIL